VNRQVAVIFCFVTGAFVVFAFFVDHPTVLDLNEKLNEVLVIVFAFALVLGVVSFVQHHSMKIRRKKRGWQNSIISLLSLTAMALLGVFEARIRGGAVIGERPAFDWLFNYMFTPLQATMFSLLAFMIASAAFRAFRIRNLEAAVLMLAAIVVMLGRVPIGEFILPYSSNIAEWIMNIPNLAAQRGILIGAALGAASMAIRVILGIERPYMGGSGE
jgi:hypothetical protein